MKRSARYLNSKALNDEIRRASASISIYGCNGQRYIGCGLKDKCVTLYGTPGNALGAYLDGALIQVHGNAQDAVGDTMNDGAIVIHGHAGDTLGYAMRGGCIYVSGNAGYRTGIHMKEYQDKKPVIMIGGQAGSFLGEYQAGGTIIVTGLGLDPALPLVGAFTGSGMHGGKIFIRTASPLKGLSDQVAARSACAEDMAEIIPHLLAFSYHFCIDATELLQSPYQVLSPLTRNPYHQLYVAN